VYVKIVASCKGGTFFETQCINFGVFDKFFGVGLYYAKTSTKANHAYNKDYRPPVPIAMTRCLDLHAGSLPGLSY